MHDRLDLRAAIDAVGGDADAVWDVLKMGFTGATAVLAFPPTYRRRLRNTNMDERLIKEIWRHKHVDRNFATMGAARQFTGTRCAM
jgi:transposase-like protein